MVAKRIEDEMNRVCIEIYNEGPRNHLGASLIGEECKRKLWYGFRWVHHKVHDGRMYRLFNRGHREEERIVTYLRAIGFTVWEYDLIANPLWYVVESDDYFLGSEFDSKPEIMQNLAVKVDSNEHIRIALAKGVKLKQIRISGCKGHFGGSLDGVAAFPEDWGIDERILLEFKTKSTGAGFNALSAKGMAVTNFQHFAQTSTYGKAKGFGYVLYISVNKNDDEMHIELVKLDHETGERMEAKAQEIIFSPYPPNRISDNPQYHKCKGCDQVGPCHQGKPAEKNCRSCISATPVDNGEWHCSRYDANPPLDVIKVGCDLWKSITQNEQ